ncbi:adenylyltransferase/cytidyltransferase family protein [Winogradskyella jejuensis]|uniref:Glycerol-3-phosphate cytidylyltransferase n=1 Tax=Winogradskyella jejuensis TaxID=1089305 RepID=A0A1M5MV13_9FLAO|nr:adenylyltransferase/cytidyltransferase family protein [Winogradskyella jejuensis]SHG80613.1 Glycerol-3-phosphate cytidylyltransferase [Winogradskyella jejuensis]
MKKQIIGYTAGVFDMFHVGHLNILKQAKDNCDYLIVAVSPDELVKSYKGKKPIIPLDDRMEIIKAIKYVDEVVIQYDRDKIKAFKKYNFDVMFVGDDWKGNDLFQEVENELKKHNSRVHFFAYTNKISSTKLRTVLKDELK